MPLAVAAGAAPPRGIPNTAEGRAEFLRKANAEGVSRDERRFEEGKPPTSCSLEPWRGIIAKIEAIAEMMDKRMVLDLLLVVVVAKSIKCENEQRSLSLGQIGFLTLTKCSSLDGLVWKDFLCTSKSISGARLGTFLIGTAGDDGTRFLLEKQKQEVSLPPIE